MSASFGTNINNIINKTEGVTVFGRVDAECVEAIDRVAEQMLMPRSWVVTQILKEWYERRMSLEVPPPGGQSWDDSIREILGRHADNEDRLSERPQRPDRRQRERRKVPA